MVAGEDGWRVRVVFASAALTDWKFAHAGWLFVVGALCHPPDPETEVLTMVRSSLETWRWANEAAGR
ncbi:MAG: hypothetical protein WKF33_04310 [Thermoleophilaceae bacterium]